jgi:spore maturation protein CgeB
MRVVMFYHSVLSDWNHGNAHFLRGIATELIARGHRVDIYEPEDSWSTQSLLQEHGPGPLRNFREAYPLLRATRYRFGAHSQMESAVPPHPGPLPQAEGTASERSLNRQGAPRESGTSPQRERPDAFLPLPAEEGRGEGEPDSPIAGEPKIICHPLLPIPVNLDLNQALDGADLVIVHEWNAHDLVRSIGEHRALNKYVLLFHDTHHRMVTEPDSMAAYDLSNYDGVLAYGAVLRELYEARGNVRRAWTWHEAADVRIFEPRGQRAGSVTLAKGKRDASETLAARGGITRDLVWIGNWGDDERTAELHEFLIAPAKELKLSACVYGVRYPDAAQNALGAAGIEYGRWLPNFEAPRVFADFKLTVHVPRRPYVKTLPGIPTIRPFEALACGIPLICSPWNDAENLFRPGQDYLVACDGAEMKRHIRAVLNDPQLAAELARHGLETIRARHTCAHRVDELLNIYEELKGRTPRTPVQIDATGGGRSSPASSASRKSGASPQREGLAAIPLLPEGDARGEGNGDVRKDRMPAVTSSQEKSGPGVSRPSKVEEVRA